MSEFKKITSGEYKDFLEKSFFSTFFHNPEWHEFLQKEFKWLKFEYYKYKDEAILPLARFKVFEKEKLVSLPFCEYGGPIILKSGINFNEFAANAFSEFGKNIKIKFHPEIMKHFNISNISNTANISTSWLENLKNVSEKELLDSFRKTLRNEIRYAQDKKTEISQCCDIRELKQFYSLYSANLKRKRTVPYPFKIFEFLYGRQETEILLAKSNNKIIGGNLFLNYGKFTHYFFSATDYKYKDSGVSYLLLWSKIKNLIGQDKILDLGATPKGSSLDTFKRGWGGKDYPILQIGTKRSEENLRFSKLRNLYGLLPNFVIKGLSKKLIKYRL